MDKFLVQFMAIVEAGSFLAAAGRLAVSQPALSYNMKKLEQSLGVQLFERSSRGVQLTPYGETLYENALMMRRLYSNAMDTLERQRAEYEDGLKIGTGYSTWNLFLKDMAIDHFKQHPNAPIVASVGHALRCMDQLLAGDISLFVGHRIDNFAHENTVHFIPIGLTQDAYFVRDGHPLLGKPRRRSEIQSYPSTLATSTEARQQRLLSGDVEMLAEHSADYDSHAFTSNSLYACIDFLRETDAVLIHSFLLTPLLEERGICKVEMHESEGFPRWTMGIYVQKEKQSDPKVLSLIDLITERAKVLDLPPPLT